jgi:hypothetical protein
LLKQNFVLILFTEATKIKGTIFESFGNSLPGFNLDFENIESTFALKPVAKKEGAPEEEEKKEVGTVNLIDSKTSQAMSMFVWRNYALLTTPC